MQQTIWIFKKPWKNNNYFMCIVYSYWMTDNTDIHKCGNPVHAVLIKKQRGEFLLNSRFPCILRKSYLKSCLLHALLCPGFSSRLVCVVFILHSKFENSNIEIHLFSIFLRVLLSHSIVKFQPIFIYYFSQLS